MKQVISIGRTLVALGMVLACSGCTVKATVKTTTDGMVNFLSSTSGRSWLDNDGLVRRGEEVRAFVALNFDQVKQNMARGGGEYVMTLASLLGVPYDRQAEFSRLARDRYAVLVPSERTTPQELLAALTREMPAGWIGRAGG